MHPQRNFEKLIEKLEIKNKTSLNGTSKKSNDRIETIRQRMFS